MEEHLVVERDLNFILTEEEIYDQATKIGIDPEHEPELLYLAKLSLWELLPPSWKICQDINGEMYFFNIITGECAYENPRNEFYRHRVVEERNNSVEIADSEIYDQATKIGIDPEHEPELLYLAKLSLWELLPPSWKICQDENGQIYFLNIFTEECTSENPQNEYYRRRVAEERENKAVLTVSEIYDQAMKIGIDPENEPELLYLAKMSLWELLPPSWKACQDENGQIYFLNIITEECTLEHPRNEYYRQRVAEERENRAALTVSVWTWMKTVTEVSAHEGPLQFSKAPEWLRSDSVISREQTEPPTKL